MKTNTYILKENSSSYNITVILFKLFNLFLVSICIIFVLLFSQNIIGKFSNLSYF